MIDGLRERIAELLASTHRKVGYTGIQTAYLGRGDGSGVIIAGVAAEPRSVFVYQDTLEGRKIFTAVLGQGSIPFEDNPSFEGFPVLIGFPPNSQTLTVLAQGSFEGNYAGGGTTLLEQRITYATYVAPSQLQPLRVDAFIDAEGNPTTAVYVQPAWYFEASAGELTYFGGDTYDLSAEIAALGSGEHQIALVSLDSATGNLVVTTGSAVVGESKDIFGPQDIDAMALPTTYLPCGAVHLYHAQASIGEADIYRGATDPRVMFTAYGSASSGGDTVRVSANDTTPDYLGEKLVAGMGITLTEQDDGANETLLVSATPPTFGKRILTRTVLYDNTRSGAGNWDVSSIPQDYDDLEIVVEGATNAAAINNDSVVMYFNNDTTATNYYGTRYFNSQTSDAMGVQRQDNAIIGFVPGNNRSSSAQWGIVIAHVIGYNRTDVRKHVISHSNERYNTSAGQYRVTNGTEWENTSAINRIAVQSLGGQFVAGSRLRIIGVREEVIGTAISEYSTANVSNPPTDAELDALFGTPATVGARWSAILNDNGAGDNEYLVWSDGDNWWYVAGTKAT